MFLKHTAFGTSCTGLNRSNSWSCSGCSSYMEDLSSGCTPDGGICMNVVAGEAALATTRAASTGWFEEVWLEF